MSLHFMLCCSPNTLRKSLLHCLHAACLRLLKYSCRFWLSGLSSSNWISGTLIICPWSKTFGVKIGYSMSPSSYIDCQLFMLISISNIASCISTVVRWVFPIVLYNICFISPIIRSNCPQHHGALLRFNFHFIFSLARKSLNSTFVYVLYPFRCIIALS